jgi:GNAT superfamily N-acetyltransferase
VVLVKEFWNLCSLFVAHDCQGQGIGRSLVNAAIDICRTKSPTGTINLNSAPNAITFYRALGFTPREASQVLPTGFLPMRLHLAASKS